MTKELMKVDDTLRSPEDIELEIERMDDELVEVIADRDTQK